MSNTRLPRRSVLYVPASNLKALSKANSLGADAVIIDLEDAVAPSEKEMARQNLEDFFAKRPTGGPETIIRVNELGGEWGYQDLQAACACAPDAILLPKVNGPKDIVALRQAMNVLAGQAIDIWAMIETAKGIVNLPALVALGEDRGIGVVCLVAGTNDLAKETGVLVTPDRQYLISWLQHIVLAARAGGLAAIDGVSNALRDIDAFQQECASGRALGFDGKTLVHPLQIEPANQAFSPVGAEISAAREILAAFAAPENAGKGVIKLDGRMVELLHLEQARAVLSKLNR